MPYVATFLFFFSFFFRVFFSSITMFLSLSLSLEAKRGRNENEFSFAIVVTIRWNNVRIRFPQCTRVSLTRSRFSISRRKGMHRFDSRFIERFSPSISMIHAPFLSLPSFFFLSFKHGACMGLCVYACT